MKNTIKKGSLLLFLASMLILASCGEKKSSSAEMTFEHKEYDFGKITQGDKVNHDFKFRNTGDADLIISYARGSCGCTVPEYPKTPIKAGESGVIKVSFNSAGKSGEVEKTVTLSCNTKEGNEVLTIKANIDVPVKGNLN